MNLPRFLQSKPQAAPTPSTPAAPSTPPDSSTLDAPPVAGFEYNTYLQQQLCRADLSSQERATTVKELRLRTDTRLTLVWIGGISLAALISAGLASCWTTPGTTRTVQHAGVTLVWAMGIFGFGLLLGFLFGIPRSFQSPTDADAGAPADPSKSTQVQATRSASSVNTNLEQVSDWLTKILIGVSLVEAKSIAVHVVGLAHLMADGDCGMGCSSLALAMLLAFTTLGFLLGYLATRMFLSAALALADGIAGGFVVQSQAVMAAVVGVNEAVGDTTTVIPPEAKLQARSIVSAQAPSPTDSFDARYVHAKSLLLTGEFAKAAIEYASLVADRPQDAKLRRERLWALFKSGRQWSSEVAGLLGALDEIRWSTDEKESAQNFLSLSFHYLYAGTQQAAQRVVDLVNEFKARSPSAVTAGMYINLACAHGQLYRLDTASQGDITRNPHTTAAAQAITEAVRLEPAAKQRIKGLMDPNAPDNDLAVFNGPQNPVQIALG